MSNKDLLTLFTKYRARAARDEENHSGNYNWNKYESPIEDYDKSFKDIFSIFDFLNSRRHSGSIISAMDFMGAGRAIRDLAALGLIDKGLSVTLNDNRDLNLAQSDLLAGCEVIGKNILQGSAFTDIREWMTKSGASEGFDLIMCDPGNGFISFPNGKLGKGMIEFILSKGLQLLKPKKGTLIASIPAIQFGFDELSNWQAEFNSNTTIWHADIMQKYSNEMLIKVERN